MQNRIFFPQAALDHWVVEGQVELAGNQLTIVGEGRRYRIAEAVHVLKEVTGTSDTHEVVGKVKSRVYFEELGAEILEDSMIIGDNAYDVIPGWAGRASTNWGAHLDSNERFKARKGKTDSGALPKNDEEMLNRFESGMLG